MQIQVNTDNNVHGREDVIRFVETTVQSKLGAIAAHLTRVEVHIGDENGPKGGGKHMRCMVEARPEGRAPVAVTHNDSNIKSAITHTIDKMRNALDSDLGKMKKHR